MESPSPEVFKRHLDLVLSDMVECFKGYNGSAAWKVGMDDLKGLYQSCWLCDFMILTEKLLSVLHVYLHTEPNLYFSLLK